MSLVFDIIQATGSFATAAAFFCMESVRTYSATAQVYTGGIGPYLTILVMVKYIECMFDKEKHNVLGELRFHLIAYGIMPLSLRASVFLSPRLDAESDPQKLNTFFRSHIHLYTKCEQKSFKVVRSYSDKGWKLKNLLVITRT
jgi:hypothetical protein